MSSGLWTALRTRPSRARQPWALAPEAIFVTAMDTNPWQPTLKWSLLSKPMPLKMAWWFWCSPTVSFCVQSPGAKIPVAGVEATQEFAGVHPAGLAGTHIHFLHPVNAARTVWSIGYQDVIAIGFTLYHRQAF